jgi:hypothetical protein
MSATKEIGNDGGAPWFAEWRAQEARAAKTSRGHEQVVGRGAVITLTGQEVPGVERHTLVRTLSA